MTHIKEPRLPFPYSPTQSCHCVLTDTQKSEADAMQEHAQDGLEMSQTHIPACTELRTPKSFSPMEFITMRSLAALFVISGTLLFAATARAADVDVDAAQALAKKSGCLKCHAVDRKKDAPSYKEIATKNKGKADAADRLYKHLTTNPKVKVDGKEETHDSLKTRDDKEIRNVVQWILSR